MANLKELVDEITNIKNELVTCHATLANTLTNKSIDVLETDKVLDLISKAGNLLNPIISYGDDIVYSTNNTTASNINNLSYIKLRTFNTFNTLSNAQYKIKSVKFSTSLSTNLQDYGGPRYLYLKMIVKDGSEEIMNKEFSLYIPAETTRSTICSIEIPNPKTSYVVEIYCKSSTTYTSTRYAGFIGDSILSGKVVYL